MNILMPHTQTKCSFGDGIQTKAETINGLIDMLMNRKSAI